MFNPGTEQTIGGPDKHALASVDLEVSRPFVQGCVSFCFSNVIQISYRDIYWSVSNQDQLDGLETILESWVPNSAPKQVSIPIEEHPTHLSTFQSLNQMMTFTNADCIQLPFPSAGQNDVNLLVIDMRYTL